ncbi:amino acid adenylation domain-containing protein (plasmid) [Streptomyces cynarae]|uniref:Amino acid adenylation domain-containing protein n=1 Tax=Streptomyces cynarae TaxID=2981134 RepID=A0ABY6EHW4_9ACTN|nr:amino acid adenylation domain-containing protein [Streptomyces cynarae]UXY24906.1 amino acid adenylation domain-containing protein [Streptomyces cynarae]
MPELVLPMLFAEHVARTPTAPAVIFEGVTLTYAELDRRANRLARHLVALGAGPERSVAVALPRSLYLVEAVLAVLKAGAAYLPLGPENPPSRTIRMLSDARPTMVLTLGRAAARFPQGVPPLVLLDDPGTAADVSALPGGELTDIDRGGALTSLGAATVIFTSGSTGAPKAVVNSHGGLVNRILWMQSAFGLTGQDRVLHKTPIGFDVSLWELLWPLSAGATMVVAAPGGHKDPRYLVRLIREERVTTAHFVPSMLRVFLEEPTVREARGLRRVVCSGEALTPTLRTRFRSVLGVPLFNLYGPTEAAIDVTWWNCTEQQDPATVPIGRPIWNTRVHVLNQELQPVAVGESGELFLSGLGLARGYVGRAGLTAERFLPDPYGPAGGRMYRTGDLARWRPDGALEYLGRIDQQVKIRGFRIELGEIEAALGLCAGVRAGAVAVVEKAGERQLVACVVADGGSRLSPAALRAELALKLPDYMVPVSYTFVGQLPVNRNGKLDREGLAALIG